MGLCQASGRGGIQGLQARRKGSPPPIPGSEDCRSPVRGPSRAQLAHCSAICLHPTDAQPLSLCGSGFVRGTPQGGYNQESDSPRLCNRPSAADAQVLQPGNPFLLALGHHTWGGGEHWRGVTRPLPRPGPRCGLGDNASPGSLCALNLPFSPTPGRTQTTPPTQSTMCSVSSRLRGEPGPRMCIWKAKISLGLGWGWRGLT